MFAATAHADDAAFTIIDPHGGGPGFAGLDRMIFPAKRDCRAKSECDAITFDEAFGFLDGERSQCAYDILSGKR